jgi:hypothetical protein
MNQAQWNFILSTRGRKGITTPDEPDTTDAADADFSFNL